MSLNPGDTVKRLVAASLATFLCLYPVPVKSLPDGGKVIRGNATITQPDATTLKVNQTKNKTIINWNGFNINVNELVQFTQPSSSSVVLNRVVGVDPSSILGNLIANGRVFIVNSNGIFFGPNSRVDVSGLFASTLATKDADFMSGKYLFTQDPTKAASYVVNQGEIKVSDNGFVFLVAPGVKNESLIIANLGKVVLASGNQFTVDFIGDGLINFVVDGKVIDKVFGPDGTALSSAVNNTGTIKADGGQVILSAKASGDIFSSVVNNAGIIEAKSLVNRGGVIRLEGSDPVENTGQVGWQANLGKVQNADGAVINAGTLDVSAAEAGAAQGEVTLSGESVGVSGTILARGADGAQGGRVMITSTDKTEVPTSGLIDTSGIGNSSAGNVVVWSDKETIFRGFIAGRGGELGGDGAHVEVSGYKYLTVTSFADLTALNGITGTLLLDPGTVSIIASASPSSGPNTFSDSYINGQLVMGNLTISTSNATNGLPENIIFADPAISISWSTSSALIFNAGRNISILGSISAGPGGSVSFSFGQAGAGGLLNYNDSAIFGPNFYLGGAGFDTIDLSARPFPAGIFFGTGNVELFIGNGGTLLAQSQPNLSWTITGPNAGNADDGGSVVAFTGFGSLVGSSGTDSFTLAGGTLSGLINGGAGNNTLTGGNVTNTWNITGLNSGTVAGIGGGFTNIQNLVGGSASDSFILAGGSLSGAIDGGLGNNTLTGGNVTNTWNITGLNSGTVAGIGGGFTNIQNLVGGNADDTFIFGASGLVSSITGGPGFDTADYSALGPITLILAGTSTEKVIGGGGTLVGSNTNNTWTINGTDAGNFSDGVGTVMFTNFINLTGGTGNDWFILAGGSLSGAIDGGLGNNTLTGGNVTNTWNITGLNSGTVNGVGAGFSNIQNLVGGNTVDNFVFNNGAVISGTVSGTAGSDTLNVSAYTSPTNVTLTASTANGYSGNMAAVSGGFDTIDVLIGGTAANTVTGLNGNATWTTSAADAGSYMSGGNTLTFSNFSIWEGGSGADTFNLAHNVGAVNGGPGNDVFNVNASIASALSGGSNDDSFVFANGAILTGSIDGGAGSDTLNLSSYTTALTFNLNSAGGTDGATGTTTGNPNPIGATFSNIDVIRGGANNDIFNVNVPVLASLFGNGGNDTFKFIGTGTATISGGPGIDTLDLSMAAAQANVTIGSADVENLLGNGGVLTGPNTDNVWTINGPNAGAVSDGTNTTTFSGFNSLTGGNLNDWFAFSGAGNVSGNINGGAGTTNTLDYSALAVPITVNFQSGTANNIGGTFSNINNLVTAGTLTVGGSFTGDLETHSGPLVFNTTTVGGNLLSFANGPVNQAGSLTVNGNASLTGTSITLGDPTNNFGTLTFNSQGPVNIHENSDTVLTGVNTAFSLVLVSAGSITDNPNTSLTVTNNASFTGTLITLGDNAGDSTNFGSLTFNSSGPVNITEDSDILLTGVNTANSLVLVSAGSITDNPNTTLTVTNNASFTGTFITLADNAGDVLDIGGTASFTSTSGGIAMAAPGTVRIFKLAFNSPGLVDITQDSDMVLTGNSTAFSLLLTSLGSITNDPGAGWIVQDSAALRGSSITLGNHASDSFAIFNSLNFNVFAVSPGVFSGPVDITLVSDMTIFGDNTAKNFRLVTGGQFALGGTTITYSEAGAINEIIAASFGSTLSEIVSAIKGPPAFLIIGDNLTSTGFALSPISSATSIFQERLVSIVEGCGSNLEEQDQKRSCNLVLVREDIIQLDEELKKRLQISDGIISDMRLALAAIILRPQQDVAKVAVSDRNNQEASGFSGLKIAAELPNSDVTGDFTLSAISVNSGI